VIDFLLLIIHNSLLQEDTTDYSIQFYAVFFNFCHFISQILLSIPVIQHTTTQLH